MADTSNVTPRLRVVLGVTGGIAAYKAVSVARLLTQAGHGVQVVPTAAALSFVGQPTWEAISRNPVYTRLDEDVSQVRHVALGREADLIIVAPATANTIARLAHGLADDLLTNTVLASRAPLLIAPAMHTEMWQNVATQANVAILRERGVTMIGPAKGALAGGDSGLGRMAEAEEIVAAALEMLSRRSEPAAVTREISVVGSSRRADHSSIRNNLQGCRLVITAGGTREPLDPVRFIGNRSSGKQGVALARAAARRGALVILIAANVDDNVLPVEGDKSEPSLRTVQVSTTAELQDAVTTAAREANVVIMAAAVADYRPATVSDQKIKKSDDGRSGADRSSSGRSATNGGSTSPIRRSLAEESLRELGLAGQTLAELGLSGEVLLDQDFRDRGAWDADSPKQNDRNGRAQLEAGGVDAEVQDGAERLTVNLIANPDILAELSRGKQPGQIIVGFAAETESDPAKLITLGREKIRRKGCDFLVVNSVGWAKGFSSDETEVAVLNRAGDIVVEASGSKTEVADRILDAVVPGR